MTLSIILLLIVALVVVPGLVLSPRTADFFMGARTAGTLAVAASLLATSLGASATVGIVALSYRIGWPAFWWLGAGSLGLTLLGTVWAERMRERPTTLTLPQWAGSVYGAPARTLAAALIVVMWSAVIAAQWVAAGAVLQTLVGGKPETGIVAAAAAVTIYTAWGGQRSVLRTDAIQVVFIAVACALPLLFLARLPGSHALAAPRFAELFHGPGFAPPNLLALLVVVGGMYVVGPDLCSRVLIARDTTAARRGAVLAGILLLPCSVALVLMGRAVQASAPDLATPQAALSWLIGDSAIMPAWAGLLVNAGLLAAMFSSADTCLITSASVFELDLVGRRRSPARQQAWGRGATVVIGGLSALLACRHQAIIPNMLLAYAFYAGGLLPPLLLLGFPRLAASVPNRWVWAAMLAGGLTPVTLLASRRLADSSTAGLCGVALNLVVLAVGACHARWRQSA